LGDPVFRAEVPNLPNRRRTLGNAKNIAQAAFSAR